MSTFVDPLVQLDVPRRIKYTAGAQVKLEEYLGKSIPTFMRTGRDIGLREITALVRAGVMHETGELSADQIAIIIERGSKNGETFMATCLRLLPDCMRALVYAIGGDKKEADSIVSDPTDVIDTEAIEGGTGESTSDSDSP